MNRTRSIERDRGTVFFFHHAELVVLYSSQRCFRRRHFTILFSLENVPLCCFNASSKTKEICSSAGPVSSRSLFGLWWFKTTWTLIDNITYSVTASLQLHHTYFKRNIRDVWKCKMSCAPFCTQHAIFGAVSLKNLRSWLEFKILWSGCTHSAAQTAASTLYISLCVFFPH